MGQHIKPLLADGRLRGADTSIPQNSSWQKYIAVTAGAPATTDEIIVDFCKQPRSRKDLRELLQVEKQYLQKHLNPLLESGKLKMTKPEMPTSVD